MERPVSHSAHTQVAPEPDMKARVTPGARFSLSSTSPMTGASAIAGGARSFRQRAGSVSSAMASP